MYILCCLPDEAMEPVVVAAGTDLAHALDFVVVHDVVAAVAAMVDADVDVNARAQLAPHPVGDRQAVLAMVVTDLSTVEKK